MAILQLERGNSSIGYYQGIRSSQSGKKAAGLGNFLLDGID